MLPRRHPGNNVRTDYLINKRETAKVGVIDDDAMMSGGCAKGVIANQNGDQDHFDLI